MGVVQARVIFFAFAGLCAVIAYNAVYLQKGSHPAPFSADVGTINLKTGSIATTGKQHKSARRKQTSPGADPKTVKAAQEELKSAGYEPGPADGVHGLQTRAAVMAYQYDNKLAITGEVSEKLLKQMIFGEKGQARPSGARPDIPEETVSLIRGIQDILAKMGYDPGPADGIMGASTRQAIQTFEREQKLPAKGRISGKLLQALAKVTGTKLAKLQSD
jgi:peptidoglycan hydrolase-like protein with peptidoglycan-binding domain